MAVVVDAADGAAELPDPGALDEGDLRSQLGSGECRLVAPWPASDHRDAVLALKQITLALPANIAEAEAN